MCAALPVLRVLLPAGACRLSTHRSLACAPPLQALLIGGRRKRAAPATPEPEDAAPCGTKRQR